IPTVRTWMQGLGHSRNSAPPPPADPVTFEEVSTSNASPTPDIAAPGTAAGSSTHSGQDSDADNDPFQDTESSDSTGNGDKNNDGHQEGGTHA
ncbi:MAG: hypothetical protein AAFP90_13305, partial [Planctomycetota bacterium]